MTVYVVLAQSRHDAVWIEGVGRSWAAADVIACFLADSDEWRGKRVLRDSTMVGTGWSLNEVAEDTSEAWDLWITVHPMEVKRA